MALETKAPGNDDLDQTLVVNGTINVRRTHPNLYRMVMLHAITCVALGLNFLILMPTFLIFDMPNQLWGGIFLAVGVSQLVFLNLYRRLRLVRASMAFAVFYLLFMAIGTSQPFAEGTGSLQLPILYAVMALGQFPLLLEPFINPWMAEREP